MIDRRFTQAIEAPDARTPSLHAVGAVIASLLILAGATAGNAETPPPVDATAPYLEEARRLAKSFSSRLQGELQAALSASEPQNAVANCRLVAPAKANELTEQHGWSVARTALRVRNPRNAPTLRERAVLLDFQRRAAAGEHLSAMEHIAIVEDGGLPYVHYMRAITTGGVCLTCHGESIDDPVREAIAALYPADAATGFTPGSLRGAFTFVRPLAPAEEHSP
ncbi:MAG: DUF3365 domain-containing protein [Pseudomonadota bacterium]